MKKYAVLAALLAVFVSYQNCAPTSASLNSNAAELTSQVPTSYNKIPVQNFHTLSVWDSRHGQFLDVDMSSGKIAAFIEGGQAVGGNFCLSPAMLASLQQILASAQICVPVVNAQQLANQVCAQEYTYAYASLIGSGTAEYKLGEKHDSCDVPSDLCGAAAANLQAWSADLVAKLSNLACQ